MKNKVYLLVVIASFFFVSCEQREKRIIDENTILDERVWEQDNILEFELNIENDSLIYDLALNIRNGLDYPFRNIFFLYSIEDEKGNLIYASQEELMLFNKLGKPLGSTDSFLGVSYGDLYYSANSFAKYKFPNQGRYKVKISQNMRNKPVLEGVMSVGLKVRVIE